MKAVIEHIAFTVEGHRMIGTRKIDATALHSGRPLYEVKCETCNRVVHLGTTSTDIEWWIRNHFDDATGKVRSP